jgi:uncharacterized membrane protein/ketosteroid isomerase-like protein
MIEIIPNWHPIFVHFTVALVVSSALFFAAGVVLSNRSWAGSFQAVGHWTLRLGAIMTLFTLLAGLQAYGSVNHDAPSHAAMTNHRNWAFVTVGLIWLSAIWSVWKSKGTTEAGALLFALLGVATLLVGITAYKGGEIVYRYGLGVQSLPKSEGDGHDHDHGGAETSQESHDGTGTSKESHGHEDSEEGEESGGHSHDEPTAKPEQEQEHADDGSHSHEPLQTAATMSDPASTAEAFHMALVEGDEETVARVLAADVVILESGHAQHSRQEYMSGHMKSDMAFLPNMQREVIEQKASQSENLAWVITHSRMFGEYKGQSIDQTSREMLVMQNTGDKWEITLIHWADK